MSKNLFVIALLLSAVFSVHVNESDHEIDDYCACEAQCAASTCVNNMNDIYEKVFDLDEDENH